MPAPASLVQAAGNASAPAKLIPEPFSSLPGWLEDDQRPAYEAFRRCAIQAEVKPYRTGGMGVPCSAFANAFAAAIDLERPGRTAARAFFEEHFRPFLIHGEDATTGFLTGYYEPEAEASPVRTQHHTVPLYRRPDDLVEIDEHSPPAGIETGYRFARRTPEGLVPYYDRRAIESGALAGRGLEIAWLADPVDAFFIHVQGAARLTMADGSSRHITYVAKSGHPFTGPGRVLAAMGEIPLQDVTMQSIRAWFRRNPRRINEILWQNRSFIFFRETEEGDPAKGPVAAAKVQLEPGRSLAVDRTLHTFATPFFIDAPDLAAVGGVPFRRLMIAQDTGSAIVGAARGDIFVGTGAEAGEIAGVIKHPGRFHILLPLPFAETFSGALV